MLQGTESPHTSQILSIEKELPGIPQEVLLLTFLDYGHLASFT